VLCSEKVDVYLVGHMKHIKFVKKMQKFTDISGTYTDSQSLKGYYYY